MPKVEGLTKCFTEAHYLTLDPLLVRANRVPPTTLISSQRGCLGQVGEFHVFPCSFTIDPQVMPDLRIRCPMCLVGFPAKRSHKGRDVLCVTCESCQYVHVNVIVDKQYMNHVLPWIPDQLPSERWSDSVA